MLNKTNVFVKTCVLMLIAVIVSSCASAKFSGTADCCGRICGEKGEGISGYTVSMCGRITVTSAGGIFDFPNLHSGAYILSGHGKGWRDLKQKVEFKDKRMVTCIQIQNDKSAYKECESFLIAKNFKAANEALRSLSEGNSSEKMYQFYKAIISYCESPTEKKRNKLSECTETFSKTKGDKINE